MANGEISGPPQVNFYSMLSGLGDTLNANAKLQQQQQVNDARKAAFTDFTALDPGSADYGKQAITIAQKLGSAGDQDGAVKFLGLAQSAADRQRQASRDAVTDQHWQKSYDLQARSAARADEGPVEKASQRAAAASSYGIQPNTPEFKTYVLTGALPEGNTTVQNQTEQRKAAAVANGLDPSSPGYQSYVLTGKMPREDAQPLTATDKKAIIEADEGVLAARTAVDNLTKAKNLSRQAFAGPMASGRGYAASFLGGSSDLGKGGIATTDLNNLVTTNALTQLKAIFGGNPTEGERAILLDIQGSANQPDEVRQKIYDRGIEAANRRLAFARQRADELRGGSYYKPQGSMSRAPVQQTQGITQQQYEALPSGSVFTAPDGTQRVKP